MVPTESSPLRIPLLLTPPSMNSEPKVHQRQQPVSPLLLVVLPATWVPLKSLSTSLKVQLVLSPRSVVPSHSLVQLTSRPTVPMLPLMAKDSRPKVPPSPAPMPTPLTLLPTLLVMLLSTFPFLMFQLLQVLQSSLT